MPSISQLEYLIAVDTHRHFGKAARACHVTQPTLSSSLAKLEDEIGVILFDRGVQPITPTHEAITIIEQARVALAEVQKISFMAQGAANEISGKLSLGLIPTISSYLLPLFLETLANKHPKLFIEIHEMTTQEIIDCLNREIIDVGILALPITGPSLQSISLFQEPFYLYVHADHLLSKKKNILPHDLDGKEMWLLEEGHCFRNQVLRACKLRGKRTALTNVKFESGSLETLKRLVSKGMGYTLIPHLAISETGDDEETAKIVKFAPPYPARDVGLIFRRAKLRLPAINALGEAIKQGLPRSLILASKNVETIGID